MSDHVPVVPEMVENSAMREQGHFWRRLGRAWLHFSGPDKARFSSSLEDQERLRRSRVLSVFFPLVLLAVLIIIPTAIPVSVYWISILTLLFFTSIAFF